MDKKIEKIFNETIIKLSNLAIQQKMIIRKIAKQDFINKHKNIDNIENFTKIPSLSELLNIMVSEYDIRNEDKPSEEIILDCNEYTQELYNHNVDTFNTLLDFALSILTIKENNKNKDYINLAKLRMEKIQTKKYITVKEFSDIYNISKTAQQNYRGRLNNPLPYHQIVENGNITYIVDEVEKWLENGFK